MKEWKRESLLKLKIGAVIAVLLLAVGTFLAANNAAELQVKPADAGKISVEFKDADIQDVFRVLALKGHVSIVTDPEVKGLITVHITDVLWETVLDTICKTYGFAYEREGNIIRVTTLEKIGQENLVTEVFTLNYAKAKAVSESVGDMKSERGKIKSDERSNLVIVTDIPTNVYKIGQVIKKLDAMTPQVTIEARIIETSLNNAESLGLQWNLSAGATGATRPTTFPWEREKSYGTYGNKYLPLGDDAAAFHSTSVAAFPLAVTDDFSYGVLDASKLGLILEALASRGKTTILSNPRITTVDNQRAKIHVGTDWPIAKYSYNEESDRFVITGWEYKSYGILLDVTPTINADGYVTLKLQPQISELQDVVNFQGANVPVLSTQTTEATVLIKDGDTLVVGGLLKDKNITVKTKVPLLGDIPLLGALFTHKSESVEKRDLLIFITPRIVAEEKMIAKRPAIPPVELELPLPEQGEPAVKTEPEAAEVSAPQAEPQKPAPKAVKPAETKTTPSRRK